LRVIRKFLDCCFQGISGFRTVYRYPHPDTLLLINKLFSECWRGGPYDDQWALSAIRFPPYGQKPLATQLVYNLIFLNNFLLGYTKNAYNQHGCSNVTWTTAKFTKANADNEAIHNAFVNDWL